eukprot:NODE_3258_length_578_cov_53.304348_g2743_i0.p2 GENE.NODE_3258_length_578_cov_53.304348_g2743_i0~~NODE_3258_length_578_cov_53.304348_g2743_i0.p2  ORF type:complete len:94 (+),score=6.93 NODE_3258_length_578_cov_53.304348_g2743_i0:268-549(+)
MGVERSFTKLAAIVSRWDFTAEKLQSSALLDSNTSDFDQKWAPWQKVTHPHQVGKVKGPHAHTSDSGDLDSDLNSDPDSAAIPDSSSSSSSSN